MVKRCITLRGNLGKFIRILPVACVCASVIDRVSVVNAEGSQITSFDKKLSAFDFFYKVGSLDMLQKRSTIAIVDL